jgi:hypothetical protein
MRSTAPPHGSCSLQSPEHSTNPPERRPGQRAKPRALLHEPSIFTRAKLTKVRDILGQGWVSRGRALDGRSGPAGRFGGTSRYSEIDEPVGTSGARGVEPLPRTVQALGETAMPRPNNVLETLCRLLLSILTLVSPLPRANGFVFGRRFPHGSSRAATAQH